MELSSSAIPLLVTASLNLAIAVYVYGRNPRERSAPSTIRHGVARRPAGNRGRLRELLQTRFGHVRAFHPGNRESCSSLVAPSRRSLPFRPRTQSEPPTMAIRSSFAAVLWVGLLPSPRHHGARRPVWHQD